MIVWTVQGTFECAVQRQGTCIAFFCSSDNFLLDGLLCQFFRAREEPEGQAPEILASEIF